MYKLSQIFIGYNDGKKEAKFRNDFEQFYFNYNKNYDKILSPDKFLLLGKKGTGKSLLGEYIKKKASTDSTWFCEISSYKQFKFHELTHLQTRDIKPNEYIAIWEWILLLEIGKLCSSDEAIDNMIRDKLQQFLLNNFSTLKIDMNKVVEITKKRNIKGSLLKDIFSIEGQAGDDTKYTPGTYLEYLDDLRETIFAALKTSNSRYTIIFDELDDQFRNEDVYKSNIISLIKVTDRINSLLYDMEIDCKIILLLRTDIFYQLNDPDLNKIEQDNSVKIDWGNVANVSSPLFDMVLLKIRQSISGMDNYDKMLLFKKLFPQNINYRTPDIFILGRTYFRPRDIVSYLNLIIDKYPDTFYFGFKGFLELEKAYSEYLYKEVKNELCGHVCDEEINEIFLLLKQFKKTDFTYSDIKEYYNNRKNLYKHIDLENALKIMFDFSIIGNKWLNKARDKHYYSWSYRENAEIDYDKDFVIHLGLRKELTL